MMLDLQLFSFFLAKYITTNVNSPRLEAFVHFNTEIALRKQHKGYKHGKMCSK